jgi:hypothetical protein
MSGKKLIAALALLIFSFCAALALGKHVHLPAAGIEHPAGPALGTIDLESNVLAQNDTSADEKTENSSSSSEAKGAESDSKSTNAEKDNSTREKSKPLKPFEPSEKIPGEQAVDFPVDI